MSESREPHELIRPIPAETRLKNGLVLLTHNHVAILQGLFDRPDGVARSRRDLVRAALPYIRLYRQLPSYWTLYHSYGLSPLWVSEKRLRNRIEFRLLPRGREIIEGKVPAHVRGIGPYVPRRTSRWGAAYEPCHDGGMREPRDPMDSLRRFTPSMVATRQFGRRQSPATGVRFLRGGEAILVLTVRALEVWDVRARELVRRLALPRNIGLVHAWDVPDSGTWMLYGGVDADLRVIDLESGRELGCCAMPSSAGVYFFGESPGLQRDGGVIHQDGRYEDLTKRLPAYRTATEVAVSPDGYRAVAAYGQCYALLWDLRRGELLGCLGEADVSGPESRIFRVAWSPTGDLVLTHDSRGRLRLWDVRTLSEILRLQTWSSVRRPVLTGPAELSFHGGLGAGAFTPDGRHVAVGDGTTVRVWETATGREGSTWIGHRDEHPMFGVRHDAPAILRIAFSANGRRALTVGVDETVRVWDVISGTELWQELPEACCVDHADIASDGRSWVWVGCPGMRLFSLLDQ